MTGRWAGTVDLGSGWLRYEGAVVSAELHAHHAVQVVAASSPVTLSDASGASVTTDLAVIPANAAHRIAASGQYAVLTYLEPAPGRPPTAGTPLSWGRAGAVLAHLTPGTAVESVAALSRLVEAGAAHPEGGVGRDALVQEARRLIRAQLPARVRLPDIAGAVALSPSRLTHRFTAAAGIPFGRWVLWERLQLAGAAVAQGADLTEAAHRSGFSDSAHLNRTFRKMFGIAPSEVTSAVLWRVHA